MSFDEDELRRLLLETFVPEAREQLQALNRCTLALEAGAEAGERDELLEEIFRQAHTLKGNSRAVGLGGIDALSHRLETLFSGLQQGTLAADAGAYDVVYRALDAIALLVDGADGAGADADLPDVDAIAAELDSTTAAGSSPVGAEAAAPERQREEAAAPERQREEAAAPERQPEEAAAPERQREGAPSGEPSTKRASAGEASGEDTVRIATSKLDALMGEVAELLAARGGEGRLLSDLRGLQLRLERLDAGQDSLQEIREDMDGLHRRMKAGNRRSTQITNDLRDDVRRARMLPVSTVLDSIPRTVRDLARELGKQVAVSIDGGDTEVDRAVLEQLRAPLTHVVRNAVDHGIELPDQRQAAGKGEQGRMSITASQQGGSMLLVVQDDGAGIDPSRVRRAATERGLLAREAAEALDDAEAVRLVFRPGFSTRADVSDLSGRGVGMDVVREHVERMQGSVDLSSRPGMGTTLTLELPLSIATTRCLVVEAAGQPFGVPIHGLDRIVAPSDAELGRTQGRMAVSVGGRPIMLTPLSEMLDLSESSGHPGAGRRPAVVLGSGDRRAAFQVDRLLSYEEFAIKPLPDPLRRVRNLAGASILGSGETVVVLNTAELLEAALEGPVSPTAQPETRVERVEQTILVVDDSMTTRTLEKNLLEAAGYRVTAASDGVQAWDLLRSDDSYDLVVSDIQMPRMDGVKLAANVRADARLKDLPFVLVTSLGSEEDRARGIEAGADAYIVKGSFDQDELLEAVRGLI